MPYPLPSNDPLGTDLRLDDNGDLVITMSGSLDVVTQADNAAQSVRIDLTTVPDLYLWDGDVGTGLAVYVDAPLTQFNEQQIQNIVIDKVQSNPRILTVQSVDVVDNQQPDTLILTVQAVVNGVGAVSIPVTVGGAV